MTLILIYSNYKLLSSLTNDNMNNKEVTQFNDK